MIYRLPTITQIYSLDIDWIDMINTEYITESCNEQLAIAAAKERIKRLTSKYEMKLASYRWAVEKRARVRQRLSARRWKYCIKRIKRLTSNYAYHISWPTLNSRTYVILAGLDTYQRIVSAMYWRDLYSYP